MCLNSTVFASLILLLSFYLPSSKVFLCVPIHVDDLIITGNNMTVLQNFKVQLNTCFHMKDLGSLKYFLGIEVVRNNEEIYFC